MYWWRNCRTSSGSALTDGEPSCARPAQREREGSPLPHHALRPHPSAQPVDDALHRRQPDAGPRELAGEVEALERPEQPVRVGHVETGAVVAHEIRRLA